MASYLKPISYLALVPVVLVAVVYWSGLDNPFVYDDEIVVVENPSIRTLSEPATLLLHDRFRPLVNLSYAIDYSFWQLRPRGYRLTNLGLHAIMALLVGLLARRGVSDQGSLRVERRSSPQTSDGLRVAASAAALFSVHPLLTEGVVYISGRSELLAGTLLLAAMLCWRASVDLPGDSSSGRRKARRWGWAIAAILCMGAAVGAKEIGAMFPFIALAYDRLLLTRPGGEAQQHRRLLVWHLPLAAMVSVAGVVRITSFLMLESERLPRPIGTNLVLQAEAVWRYCGLFVWPSGQSIAYSSQVPESLLTVTTTLAILALLGWLLLLLSFVRRASPFASFGGLWFLLVLTPSSLLPLNELMAEHRTYVAAAGLVWMTTLLWSWLRSKTRLATVGGILVLVILGQLTISRVGVWANPLELWRQASLEEPDSWRAHHGLAEARVKAGNCEEAILSYRRALDLQPQNAVPTSNLGICLAQAGRYEQARAVFDRILRHDPSSISALNNLGRLALLTGDGELATEYFRRARSSDPHHPRSLTNLILVLDATGDRDREVPALCAELSRLVVETDRPAVCREQVAPVGIDSSQSE